MLGLELKGWSSYKKIVQFLLIKNNFFRWLPLYPNSDHLNEILAGEEN